MFPDAPESTIMKIGLVRSKFASIALATSLEACVQISMSSWRRSSSVIRPRSYCFWTFAACVLELVEDLGLARRA